MGKLKDMTGVEIGFLKVINRCGSNNGKALWHCICKCGNTSIISGDNLRNGHTRSCGCAGYGSRTLDLSGQIFGSLKVTNNFIKTELHQIKWECECLRCGSKKFIMMNSLRRGLTKTCGCGMITSGKGHRHPYNGNSYRSRYEVAMAALLDSVNLTYQYEPQLFEVTTHHGKESYLPDFYIPATNLWIEVKGYTCFERIRKYAAFTEPKILIGETELTQACDKSIRVLSRQCSLSGNLNPLIQHISQIQDANKSLIKTWVGA